LRPAQPLAGQPLNGKRPAEHESTDAPQSSQPRNV
jgi:hypothetical protein